MKVEDLPLKVVMNVEAPETGLIAQIALQVIRDLHVNEIYAVILKLSTARSFMIVIFVKKSLAEMIV